MKSLLTTLDKVGVGVKFEVVNILGDGPLAERLKDLGLVAGAIGRVTATSPLKGASAIHFCGQTFALSESDLQIIAVRVKKI